MAECGVKDAPDHFRVSFEGTHALAPILVGPARFERASDAL